MNWNAISEASPEAVVLHTSFLSLRWGASWPAEFDAVAQALSHRPGLRILLPQDEFLRADSVSRLALALGAQRVHTCAKTRDIPVLYPDLVAAGVTFESTLTGWLDDCLVRRARAAARPWAARSIDVGYRSWSPAPWLGAKARVKREIAEVAAEVCRRRGWRCDISTADSASFVGDSWLSFLGDCRVTLGVEGGASIADRDGALRDRSERGGPPPAERDGEIDLFCLSPRHLEAAATGTVQVLVSGDYSGVLEAGRHYIPVRADLSDLEEALGAARDERLARRLTETAAAEVVDSGRWSYARLADSIDEIIERETEVDRSAGAAAAWERLKRQAARTRVAEVLESRLSSTPALLSTARALTRGLRALGARAQVKRWVGRPE